MKCCGKERETPFCPECGKVNSSGNSRYWDMPFDIPDSIAPGVIKMITEILDKGFRLDCVFRKDTHIFDEDSMCVAKYPSGPCHFYFIKPDAEQSHD